jgi:hypothetical protein
MPMPLSLREEIVVALIGAAELDQVIAAQIAEIVAQHGVVAVPLA